MQFPAAEDIRDAASHAVFGKRLIQNNFRAVVAETIVDFALKPTWRHCSENWGGWDFQHTTGMRLEVKQSALRQSWKQAGSQGEPRFDIAARSGYWHEGINWIPKVARHADIYIFALHSVTDDNADHRDASQWRFYVVEASKLPPSSKTIGISRLRTLASAVEWQGLFEAIEGIRMGLVPLSMQSACL